MLGQPIAHNLSFFQPNHALIFRKGLQIMRDVQHRLIKPVEKVL